MLEYSLESLSASSKRYDYSKVWDAGKLYGCVCDKGYEGYDCSLSKSHPIPRAADRW
jgi:hypothetical protein